MNIFHHWFCRSNLWSRTLGSHIVPWVLEGVDLGSDVLELGSGYGASSALLRPRCETLTCVESDPKLAAQLRSRLEGSAATVLHGDAAALPLPEAQFDSAVCFMMLHHVTPSAKQVQLFAETLRVLRPGGFFVGADSPASPMLSVFHLFDKVAMVDPALLQQRLTNTGFEDVQVETDRCAFRFRARKPSRAAAAASITTTAS